MISPDTYAVYRAAVDKADGWVLDATNGRGWVKAGEPDYVRSVTNTIRAEVEQFEVYRDKPQYLTLYAEVIGGNSLGKTLFSPAIYRLTDWAGLPYGTFTITNTWRDRHNTLRCQIVATLPDIGTYRGQWCTQQQCVKLRRAK